MDEINGLSKLAEHIRFQKSRGASGREVTIHGRCGRWNTRPLLWNTLARLPDRWVYKLWLKT